MSDVVLDVTDLIFHRIIKATPTGIPRVELEYIRHFKDRSTALIRLPGRWVELTPSDSQKIFNLLLDSSTPFTSILLKLMGAVPKCIGRLLTKSTKSRYLLKVGYGGLYGPFYPRHLRASKLKSLFFIHDQIPITHPQFFRFGVSFIHKRRVNIVATAGSGVITPSNETLMALDSYARTNHLTLPASLVAPLAPASLPKPCATSPLKTPYFVMLGTIEPRKNHWLLLQIWRHLIQDLGNKAPCLVIIGKRGWKCKNVVELLERCPTLRNFVIERSRSSDTELATWLKHAQALLFPTFIEGYGLPLMEALAQGTPTIVSDIPIFHEIAGDIPEYANPLDDRHWMKLILDYTKPDSSLRQAQHERIKGFKVPTWEAHFEQVKALMERLSYSAKTP